jgi:hypothetical protein
MMNETDPTSIEVVNEQRDVFIERFLGFASGAFNIFAIYIGDRLGLYRALVEGGPSTAKELAARTHTQLRYVHEWLEQQTVAGILEVEDENLASEMRRFQVPPGHVEPLIQCDSLNYLAPLAQLIAGAVRPLPDILEAYRNGGGVPFSAYGTDLREGQAAINYPAFATNCRMAAQHDRCIFPLATDPPAGSGYRLRLRLVEHSNAKQFPKVHGWL